MSKKVLILSSSLQQKQQFRSACRRIAPRGRRRGSQCRENQPCREDDKLLPRGCLTCLKTGKCIINDDSREITEKMFRAEVIVFATPVYYYSICGQLKTLFDRANALFASDYSFRDIYLLAAAAEDEDETVKGAVTAVQGWVDCFEKAALKKTIFAGGVSDAGDIKGHRALREAYETGMKL